MKFSLRVTGGYLMFGIFWILASDRLVEMLPGDLRDWSYFQTLKGLTFVLLSALLVSLLTRQAMQKQVAQQNEKAAVFRKTVEGSHHILLNYLNKMQLVTIEAESCPGFKRETLALAHDASQKAEIELQRLNAITTITPEQIDSTIYRAIHKAET